MGSRVGRAASLHVRAFALAALTCGFGMGEARAALIDDCGSSEPCRRGVELGDRMFGGQLYAAARTSYQNAYSAVAAPSLLLRVGRCEQLLGHTQEARAIYRKLRTNQTALDIESSAQLTEYSAELDAGAKSQSFEPELGTPRQPDGPKPVYKTWWFWTATGLAVGGIITGLAVGLSPRAQKDVVWAP